MSYSLAFVTGTSSGIGEALARDLLSRGWHVVGASRRAGAIEDPNYTHLQLDLAEVAALARALDRALGTRVDDAAVTRLGLVNNAATEALLGPIDRLDAGAMLSVYAVNTAAPVALMGWFQRRAGGRPLRIVNVSTGAAVDPFPGMAAYANTKAALRMAGMVMAAEIDLAAARGASGSDVTVLSYEPGLVDTPMQTNVRNSAADVLPVVDVFKNFKASGMLVAPEQPAREIADYLAADGHPTWSEHRFTLAAGPSSR